MFSQKILDFYFTLPETLPVPKDIGVIYPFGNDEARRVMTAFYEKYYNDSNERIMLFGINPGRFGAGVTGVPFTCPIRLENECGIPNAFAKKFELSSEFVYMFINAFGGIEAFCKRFFITSISPLGFLKNGINYNYYDDKELQKSVTPFILESIEKQLQIGGSRKAAISIGMGKNAKFFNAINKEHQIFEEIIPLHHPRWVMQYRRKSMEKYVEEYRSTLERLANS